MGLSSVKTVFQKPEFGLLAIRVATGSLMLVYGLRKFSAGEETLRAVGGAIENITGTEPTSSMAFLAGVLAAGSQLVGGALLMVGWLFRFAALSLMITMSVAAIEVASREGSDLATWGHPLLFALVCFGLIWTGPGRISIQKD